MNKAIVRVELKDGNYDVEFRKMWSAFKRKCTDAGIARCYKQHQHFESCGDKRRRKKREAAVQRIKAKLREETNQQSNSRYGSFFDRDTP